MTLRIDIEGSPGVEELGPMPPKPGPFQRMRSSLFGMRYALVVSRGYLDGGIWDYGWEWIPESYLTSLRQKGWTGETYGQWAS